MKKLLEILVLGLFLITPSWADDIKDFQIEGMSIGDSALDFFSKDEIKKALNKKLTYPGSKKFFQIDPFKKHETYENVSFSIKKGDKKYVIYQIKGMLAYANKLDECLKKKEIIIKDISSILVNAEEDKYENEFVFGKMIQLILSSSMVGIIHFKILFSLKSTVLIKKVDTPNLPKDSTTSLLIFDSEIA